MCFLVNTNCLQSRSCNCAPEANSRLASPVNHWSYRTPGFTSAQRRYPFWASSVQTHTLAFHFFKTNSILSRNTTTNGHEHLTVRSPGETTAKVTSVLLIRQQYQAAAALTQWI